MRSRYEVIDFRFRPNTPEIINGIKNSTMFKAACKAMALMPVRRKACLKLWKILIALAWNMGVITGRDAETTYGFPANNGSVLEFCKAYPSVLLVFGA